MTARFDLSLLLDMLTYCRPARSATTATFCDRFIAPLTGAQMDPFGNWHVRVGESSILWSAHCDTVHRTAGRQTVHYDRTADTVSLSKRSKLTSSCLGADDTAGVFLLVQMITALVPGHYVFHFAEEIGGLGSSDLAEYDPANVSSSTFAIALDRKGVDSVITHQYGRCCSDAFGNSLAAELNRGGNLRYVLDQTGVFTDTANYTGLVRECCNLSVGYEHAHTSRETLDIGHLRRLLTALCTLDQSALVAERNVTDDEDEYDCSHWTSLPVRTYDSPVWGSGDRGGDRKVLPFKASDVDSECYTCGYWYVTSTSDAINEPDVYCSSSCENYDLNVRIREQHDSSGDSDDDNNDRYDGVYLDEIYDAVQEAIKALPRCRVH